MNKYEDVLNKLNKYNQEHLLMFWNELDENQKDSLLLQIENIDFELIKKLYEDKDTVEFSNKKIEPIEYDIEENILNIGYEEIGKKVIQNGEYAVCVMAGGQGTRLGHNGPKGTFVVNTNPPMSIFEILINKLKEKSKIYGKDIFLYIMTSKDNNDETVAFFEKNNYFAYDKSHVVFFKQGLMPMVDTNGKVLLEEKHMVKEAADGNGGIFESLYRNNILIHMRENNIKYLEVKHIDNILFNICDETALGLVEKDNISLLSKSLVKSYSQEKVGVFCKKDRKLGVIEYSEMPQEYIELKNDDGNLVYGESYFGSNIFNINVLENIANNKLPYHIAFKKASYINENGIQVIPDTPNAYKFETFIFDAFLTVENYKILRVKREDEFAPIKNKEGVDSPETALKLYNAKYNN